MHLSRDNLFPNIVWEGYKPFLLIICSSISALLGCLNSYAADITLSGSKQDPVIFINGDLKPGDGDKFSIIANSVRNARVSLNSNGGNLFSGLQIGTIIRSKSFSTVVNPRSLCASACGLVWFAGSPRYLNNQSKIGFHSAYQVIDGKATETGVGNALVGSYLSKLGASDQAIVFFTLAKPEEINWLSPAIAKDLGISFIEFSSTNHSDSYIETKRSDSFTRMDKAEKIAYQVAAKYFEMMMRDKSSARYYLLSIFSNTVLSGSRFVNKSELASLRVSQFHHWSSRAFSINNDSISIYCVDNKSCEVSGSFTWAGYQSDYETGTGLFRIDVDLTTLNPTIFGDEIEF